jgi:glycosidase
MRTHPHLYEISLWPWLEAMSREQGRQVTLGNVPQSAWDRLEGLGFDIIYLMGVWRRSAIGRQIARSEPSLFEGYDGGLPGWQPADVVGSPYCISDYAPDPRVGTWDDLDRVREALHARGMSLVLDFVPNHTAFDHPWVAEHTSRFLTASLDTYRRAPRDHRLVEPVDGAPTFVACGRDPYFPPWTDVAQLNYFSAETRRAMVAQLSSIAAHCDGARCDMAMLVLNDVFARTWNLVAPPTEFWAEVRQALPDFMLIAEVYWDLEYRLQQLGFTFTYDKRLYDRLLHEPPSAVRDHLRADREYQERSARFLENHDEARSLAAFGPDRIEAAAAICATTPGLRFYYDGQLEGRQRRAPVQLGRWADEPRQPDVEAMYERLLHATDDSVFHDGEWRLAEVTPTGWTGHENLIAFTWRGASSWRLIAANPGRTQAEGHVQVPEALLAGERDEPITFTDLLHDREYAWDRAALRERGLWVKLDAGRAHLFQTRSGRPGRSGRSG